MLAPPPVHPCARAPVVRSVVRRLLAFRTSFQMVCRKGGMPRGEQAKGQRKKASEVANPSGRGVSSATRSQMKSAC
jgi:hypothetical protein